MFMHFVIRAYYFAETSMQECLILEVHPFITKNILEECLNLEVLVRHLAKNYS